MKVLITILIGLLVGGCGKEEQTDTNEPTPIINTNKVSSTTEKPVKELTSEEQKVVGEYEFKDNDGYTSKQVLLDNGVHEWHENGEKLSAHKWSVVKDEIHIAVSNAHTDVFRINPDKSITEIASINLDGKRTDRLKEQQYTFIKVK